MLDESIDVFDSTFIEILGAVEYSYWRIDIPDIRYQIIKYTPNYRMSSYGSIDIVDKKYRSKSDISSYGSIDILDTKLLPKNTFKMPNIVWKYHRYIRVSSIYH